MEITRNQANYLTIVNSFLCLFPGKEKLDLLSQSQFPTDNALDELSCLDNNSSYEEASSGPGAETYVITDSRARSYLVTDALSDMVATIIEPARSREVSKRWTSDFLL